MQINRIDHLVLTVADIEGTVDFYQRDPDGYNIEAVCHLPSTA